MKRTLLFSLLFFILGFLVGKYPEQQTPPIKLQTPSDCTIVQVLMTPGPSASPSPEETPPAPSPSKESEIISTDPSPSENEEGDDTKPIQDCFSWADREANEIVARRSFSVGFTDAEMECVANLARRLQELGVQIVDDIEEPKKEKYHHTLFFGNFSDREDK